MRVRKITMPVYFSIVILYLEMVFHIYEFRSLSGGFFFMTLFSVMGGVLIGALIGKMRERAAYIVTIVVTAVLCLFFCAEIVYKSVFQKFLALFSMLGVAGQAFDFMDVIGKNILLTISGLILDELEHIPHSGEYLQWECFRLEVVDMDGARIDKVLATMIDTSDNKTK